MTDSGPRWLVSQFGAREHYAVPRALHRRGHLRLFFTEAWCRAGSNWLRHGPAPLRALAARHHAELPSRKVVSFTPWEFRRRLRERLLAPSSAPKTVADQFLEFQKMGAGFDQRVARRLRRFALDPARDRFFGFENGALACLEFLAEQGIPTVLDQMDGALAEQNLVRRQAEAWPGWERFPGTVPDTYYDRVRAEWRAARLVLVNSDWSRRLLVEQGVPAEKLVIVPLAYEPPRAPLARAQTQGRFVVLWVGTVELRKGIPYLVEAAWRLTDRPIDFVVAGPLAITDAAVASAPRNMRFLGRITRDRVAELYSWADLFVFPTISDGFGITQLEAMGHGLPVIATHHCGEVVRPGIDGLVVPAADSAALADAIAELESDRPRLAEMAPRAVERAGQFGLDIYADRLEAALEARIAAPEV